MSSTPDEFGVLLDRAMELSTTERNRFLEAECRDPDMRREILDLLAMEETVAGFLDVPAVSDLDMNQLDEALTEGALDGMSMGDFQLEAGDVPVELGTTPGTIARIGAYEIVEPLGHGGMGRVFLAEQQAPVVRRVALKLLKSSLISPLMIRRFMAERQVMARLSHAHIAQIFDAGTTQDGHPFIVMEYVPGSPLTKYCDRHALPIDQRLNLFIQVCHGVQHAHLNRVLHRDLKPSNVLVTERDGRPTVKIIDFGIAKALDQDSGMTLDGVVSGTPAYMSPEALAAADGGPEVDTRTDVYSLGVLLFELLIGRRPFGGHWPGTQARVTERETPSRPSKQLSEVDQSKRAELAEARSMGARALGHALATDLDWIVLKAMAFDREQRYTSCAELAHDLERYLAGEPVEARPPSALYRLNKLARQNLGAVVAITLIIASLATGLVALTLEADRTRQALEQAQQARDEERRQRQQAEKVADFMSRSMIEGALAADPWAGQMMLPLVSDRVRRQGEEELADDPLTLAAVLVPLALIHESLGRFGEACKLFERTLSIRRDMLSASHPELLASYAHMARCLESLGESERARNVLETAIAQAQAHADEVDSESLAELARQVSELGSVTP